MIRIIIIEDEKAALRQVLDSLARVPQDIEVIATLSSVKEGISFLTSNPGADLILSDVQLGDGLSFEIFREVSPGLPVIFITGYDHFMMTAFEHNGIDYLLKPINHAELSRAVSKYTMLEKHFTNANRQAVDKMIGSMKSKKKQRVLAKRGIDNVSLRIEDIVLFYTESKLVFVLDREGHKYVCDRNLS